MANSPNILGQSNLRFFPLAVAYSEPPPAPANGGETVRLIGRSLSVMQKEAIAVSSHSARAWRLVSDEGAYLDGADEAPPPLAFLSTGMVASYMRELLALAEARGIAIDDVELTLDNYYTMKGSALRGTMIGGAEAPVLTARIKSDAPREMLEEMLLRATVASPLNGLVSGVREGVFTLTHAGKEVAPRRVPRLDSPALGDPDPHFETISPAPGDWSDLLHRGDLTPPSEETNSSAGSSLTEDQDRRLHIRAVCTIREDGVKLIRESMFNPRGSMFQFLSDEAVENGGGGRAPDAASYLAAGIGFCFMTQLGRYAKIHKRDLSAYRIVQDIDMTLGGISSATGEPGDATEPRTHVYLVSKEDADFGRDLLDMGEQTCFLHALCRTPLNTRIQLA